MSHALLVVDMQRDLLAADGRFPVSQEQVGGLLEKTNQAIASAEARGIPVVYISNMFSPWDPGNLFRGGCCVRGRDGSELDTRLCLVAGAPHFEKWRGSAFCNSNFEQWMRGQGVDSVAIAGVYANACVQATAKGALKRGIEVTVLSDAVAAKGERGRDKGIVAVRRAGAGVASVNAWMKHVGMARA